MSRPPKKIENENLLLMWENHNTADTSFIGDLDVCTKPGYPFTPITSNFSYEPQVDVDGMYDRRLNTSQSSTGIQGRPMTMAFNTLAIMDLPYAKPKMVLEYNNVGNPTGKQKTVYETVILNRPYQVPNIHNLYLSATGSKNFYNNQMGVPNIQFNSNDSKLEDKFIAPPISEAEVRAIRSNTVNTENSHHVTKNFKTKEHFRSHSEYLQGNLREYIFMSLGDVVKTDEDGNEIVITAENNLIRVPIFRDPYFNMSGVEIDSDAGLEHAKRSIYILPEFIKEMNKLVSANTLQNKYTAKEQKEFEEFIAERRASQK